MAAESPKPRKNGLYHLFLTSMEQEWAERVLHALDPFYRMVEIGFELLPEERIEKDAVMLAINAAMGTDLPVMYVSAKEFPQCDEEEERNEILERRGIGRVLNVDVYGPQAMSIVHKDDSQDILARSLMDALDDVTSDKYPALNEYNLPESSDVLGGCVIAMIHSLVLMSIQAGYDHDELKLGYVAGLIGLFPQLWLMGQDEEGTQWIVLCG